MGGAISFLMFLFGIVTLSMAGILVFVFFVFSIGLYLDIKDGQVGKFGSL
jgi:hypothetical protein